MQRKVLAVLVGSAVAGSAAISGGVAGQFRNVVLDLDAELPSATGALLAAPFSLYLSSGVILGVLMAWSIWMTKSKVHALLIAAATATSLGVLWIGFVIFVVSPMLGLLQQLDIAETEGKGAQSKAADSR